MKYSRLIFISLLCLVCITTAKCQTQSLNLDSILITYIDEDIDRVVYAYFDEYEFSLSAINWDIENIKFSNEDLSFFKKLDLRFRDFLATRVYSDSMINDTTNFILVEIELIERRMFSNSHFNVLDRYTFNCEISKDELLVYREESTSRKLIFSEGIRNP